MPFPFLTPTLMSEALTNAGCESFLATEDANFLLAAEGLAAKALLASSESNEEGKNLYTLRYFETDSTARKDSQGKATRMLVLAILVY